MMKSDTRILLLVLVLCSSLLVGCDQEISRAEANINAQEALERLSKRESLILSRFSAPEVTDDPDVWLYIYTYSGSPRQSVAITVHKTGETEVGRMLEETIQ
jgi:hypothetical protein